MLKGLQKAGFLVLFTERVQTVISLSTSFAGVGYIRGSGIKCNVKVKNEST